MSRSAPLELSVVVPTLDDADSILKTIGSLSPLPRRPWELIIFDGASTDLTAQRAFDAVAGSAAAHVYSTWERTSRPRLVDAALQVARGRWVAVVDPGAAIGHGHLWACLRSLEEDEARAVAVVSSKRRLAAIVFDRQLRLEAAEDRPQSVVASLADAAAANRIDVRRIRRKSRVPSDDSTASRPSAVTPDRCWRMAEPTISPLPRDAAPVLLMPGVGYHLVELNALHAELARRGIPASYVVLEHRWDSLLPGLRQSRAPVHQRPDDPTDLLGTRALVTMNDWGDFRAEVETANAAGIPTFGKIEGVQDFDDDDIAADRGAYRTVRHILCQGARDVAASHGESKIIVGSTRLERIWREPPRPVPEPLAVINVNFTYGVLEDVRTEWLEAAIAGCTRAGIPYAISQHPAERTVLDDAAVSREPMSHLLTKASVLISRFSTVPFEAMARGVPFVYFNPHGELVPTFHDTHDAFDSAAETDALARAIEHSQNWVDRYRDRAGDLFLQQVDVAEKQSSAERTADVIEAHL